LKDSGVGNGMVKATASVKQFLLVEMRVYIIQIIHSMSAFIHDSCYIPDIMTELVFIGKFSIGYGHLLSNSAWMSSDYTGTTTACLLKRRRFSQQEHLHAIYGLLQTVFVLLHEIAQLLWI
jgi:hypothetical protein